jgi:shikimate dehydrogenase
MRGFGLIGFPLSHSFSGAYFARKFEREGIGDCSYDIYPLEHIDLLPDLIRSKEYLQGLNVTIPYKEQVIPYLDSVDKDISDIGAVNTIKIFRRGDRLHLKGYNTDVFGFYMSLKPLMKENFSRALILGTGGASKAAAHVLKRMGLAVTYVSRVPKKAGHLSYDQVTPQFISTVQVIVNTSPSGMYPNIDAYPDIPYERLTPEHVLFDLIYNPTETKFLALGRSKGATIKNGLQMLHLQADRSWEIWNSDEFSDSL